MSPITWRSRRLNSSLSTSGQRENRRTIRTWQPSRLRTRIREWTHTLRVGRSLYLPLSNKSNQRMCNARWGHHRPSSTWSSAARPRGAHGMWDSLIDHSSLNSTLLKCRTTLNWIKREHQTDANQPELLKKFYLQISHLLSVMRPLVMYKDRSWRCAPSSALRHIAHAPSLITCRRSLPNQKSSTKFSRLKLSWGIVSRADWYIALFDDSDVINSDYS